MGSPTFITNRILEKLSYKKMLESRPEDALVKLVKTVEIVKSLQ